MLPLVVSRASTLKCVMCECLCSSDGEGPVGTPALSGFLTYKHNSFCVVSRRYTHVCVSVSAGRLHKMLDYVNGILLIMGISVQ